MTAINIVYRALRLIGVLESGETPEANVANDALYVLNCIIKSLNNEGLIAYSTVNDIFSLVAGTGYYTIGSGGTFDTTRPQEIISAFIRDDSDYDHNLKLIGRKEYDRLYYKDASTNIPTQLYYNPTYPLGYIYLWPIPAEAYTIGITQNVQLTEFASLAATASLPDGFENMYAYLLAVEIAPEYGKKALPTIQNKAIEYKASIKRMNNQKNKKRANLSVLNSLSGGSYGTYNINSDTYI